MAWSKNVSTYPTPLVELWYRVMETGRDSVHSFETKEEAQRFQRNVMGIRYAHMHTKNGPNKEKAASFTAEITGGGLQVRLCSVDDTDRAQVAAKALGERREQDEARGIVFTDIAGNLDQYIKEVK